MAIRAMLGASAASAAAVTDVPAAPKKTRATRATSASKAEGGAAATPAAAPAKRTVASRKKAPATAQEGAAAVSPPPVEAPAVVPAATAEVAPAPLAAAAPVACTAAAAQTAGSRPRTAISIMDYKACAAGAAVSEGASLPEALGTQHIILRLRITEPAASGEGDISAFCSGMAPVASGAGGAEGGPLTAAQTVSGGGPVDASGAPRPRGTVQCVDAACHTCFWCCHRFEGEIVRLPMKVLAGAVMGVGSFCSYECATAFNFHSREIMHNPWQSYELINLVAQRSGLQVPVRQAPSRFTLKMFGGPDDIMTFRDSARATASLPHPVIPLTHYLEDTYSMERDGGLGARGTAYVPLDHDRVLKAKQNLMVYDQNAKKTGIHSKLGALRGQGAAGAAGVPSEGAAAV